MSAKGGSSGSVNLPDYRCQVNRIRGQVPSYRLLDIGERVVDQRLNNDAAPAVPNNPALIRLNQVWPLPLRR